MKHATTIKTNDECNGTEGGFDDTFKDKIDMKISDKSKPKSINDLLEVIEEKKEISKHSLAESRETKIENLSCPKDYDSEVWKELPEDQVQGIQKVP